MTYNLAGVRCWICDRLAPITDADLTGADPDDSSSIEYTGWSIADLLKPTAPPSGHDMLLAAPATPAWMNVPEAVDTEPDPRVRDANYDENYRPEFDPDPIMCISHATEAELDAWLQRLGDTDEAIVNVMVDELHDDLDET